MAPGWELGPTSAQVARRERLAASRTSSQRPRIISASAAGLACPGGCGGCEGGTPALGVEFADDSPRDPDCGPGRVPAPPAPPGRPTRAGLSGACAGESQSTGETPPCGVGEGGGAAARAPDAAEAVRPAAGGAAGPEAAGGTAGAAGDDISASSAARAGAPPCACPGSGGAAGGAARRAISAAMARPPPACCGPSPPGCCAGGPAGAPGAAARRPDTSRRAMRSSSWRRGEVAPTICDRACAVTSAARDRPAAPMVRDCTSMRASSSSGMEPSAGPASEPARAMTSKSLKRCRRSSTKRRGSCPEETTRSTTRKTPAPSEAARASTQASSMVVSV